VHLDGADGVLRVPGLNKRTWEEIREEAKKAKVSLKSRGIGAKFPLEQTEDEEEEGGEEGDDWDDLDKELKKESEMEALGIMEEDGDFSNSPIVTVAGLGEVEQGKRVERLLQVLLPFVNVIQKRQESDANAMLEKIATRERQQKAAGPPGTTPTPALQAPMRIHS